jgi:hypothetical protein
MGTRRYVLSVDNDNEFRSRCEWTWVRSFNWFKIEKNHDFCKKQKILVWYDDPPEDRVISIFAGCLTNHDRVHSLSAKDNGSRSCVLVVLIICFLWKTKCCWVIERWWWGGGWSWTVYISCTLYP